MSLDNPEHSLSNGPAGPSTQPPRSPSSRLQRLTSLSARRTRSHELSEMNHVIRTASSRSEDPELPRPPRAPSPEPPEANAPPPEDEVTRLRLSAHYAILVLASMVGTLIRLGLEALATYDGMTIYSLAWAQSVGCGIMGLALARKNEIIAIYPPLYTFLTTGIAGSVTTFSSWMLESYLAFSNADQYNRKGLHDTVDGLGYSFSTFAISLSCIHLGAHISSLLPALPTPSPRIQARPISEPRGSSSTTNDSSSGPKASTPNHITSPTPLLDVLTIFTAFLSYLIALLLYFLGPNSWRHRATFPILLAPPGTILRFFLSNINTRPQLIDRFPLGTLISNMIATLLISGVFAAQRRPSAFGNAVRCNALYAIQQGFCGCLSTVSTFVVEARVIKGGRWKWVYIGGSVVLGHCFVLAIVGGVGWKEGFIDVCTG